MDDDLKDGINLTTGLENLENYGNRILIDMARVYRRSSLVEKIKGIVYITFILGGMLAFAVVLTLGYYTWALIVWGIVAFMLIMPMAIIRIAEYRVLSYRNYKDYMKNEKDYIKNTAVVKFCSISSESYTFDSSFRSGRHKPYNRRVAKTVYKIILEICGEEKKTYSYETYYEGEKLNVAYKKNSSVILILGREY